MKKLLFMMLIAPLFCYSQSQLELTTKGLKLIDHSEKEYIIIEKKGSQSELYNHVKAFISSAFTSPKDVMSESAPTSITLNGITESIEAKKGLAYMSVRTNYTIVFHFKEDRVRIDIPIINRMTSESSSTIWQLTINQDDLRDYDFDHYYIFDKKGKLKNKSAKESIESYFNGFIKSVVDFKNPQNEDW